MIDNIAIIIWKIQEFVTPIIIELGWMKHGHGNDLCIIFHTEQW